MNVFTNKLEKALAHIEKLGTKNIKHIKFGGLYAHLVRTQEISCKAQRRFVASSVLPQEHFPETLARQSGVSQNSA